MAMIDNEGLSPLGVCRLWGINKYAQESACECENVSVTRDFCLYPWIGPTGFSEGGLGVKKVRPIRGDLRYILPSPDQYELCGDKVCLP